MEYDVTSPVRPRRIWSEFVPYERLKDRAVLELVSRRDIQLLVAVTPDVARGFPAVVGACRDAGVSVGAWPMLDRPAGRWPSAMNVDRYRDFVGSLFASLERDRVGVDVLAVDLEPPLEELDRVLHGDVRQAARWAQRGGLRRAAQAFESLVSEVHARGAETLAAVVPAVLGDRRGGRVWQRALGTPVDDVPFSRVSPMLYTSLVEGYTRGLVRRRDALSLLALSGRAARRRWGARAGLSLGAVGPGVVGDEPTFRSPRELAEDAAEARAAGVDDLALFDLTGVLARPPAEAWLDALVHTPPAPRSRPLTARAAAVAGAVGIAGRLQPPRARTAW